MRGTSLDPTTSHSIWNINNWTGGGGGGGNEAADTEAEYQAWLRAERKKAREGIDKTFAPYGLDDNAFAYGDPIRRKYQKFVMDAPITGIKAQRRTAGADLAAALERQGLGKVPQQPRRMQKWVRLLRKHKLMLHFKGIKGNGCKERFNESKTGCPGQYCIIL